MMQHWTDGHYASTVHRVINRSAKTRHSMAYFFDPDPQAELKTLPGCAPQQGFKAPAKPLTALEHLLLKIGNSFEYREEK